MRQAWAIARIEIGLLGPPAFVATVIATGLAVTAAALAGAIPPGGFGLVAGAMLLIAMAGQRMWTAARTWADLLGPLPLPARRVWLTRMALWSCAALGLAGFLGVAAVAHTTRAARLEHVGLAWAWLVCATATLGLAADLQRRRDPREGAMFAMTMSATLVTLIFTAPRALTGDPSLGSARNVLVGAGIAVLLSAAFAASGHGEWLPRQSPKPVLPRSLLRGGLRFRSARPLPRAAVMRALLGSSTWIPLWSVLSSAVATFVGWTAFAASGEASPWRASLVGVGLPAILLARHMTTRARGWATLRAYPVSWERVWGMPVAGLVLGLILGAAGVAWFRVEGAARIVAPPREVFFTTVPGSRLADPSLLAPAWVAGSEAMARRPALMPMPRRDGTWPLRAGGVPIPDEGRYFVDAARYYLHVVCGLDLAPREVHAFLGAPLHLDEAHLHLPARAAGEFAAPLELLQETDRDRYFRLLAGYGALRLPGANDVEFNLPVFEPGPGPPQQTQGRSTWSEEVRGLLHRDKDRMYVFADALDRMQRALGPRLRAAALLDFLLHASVWLVAVLLAVRAAFSPSRLRLVLTALPLALAGYWLDQRGTPWQLAVLDFHHSAPWVIPPIALLAALGCAVSLRRRLAAAPPPRISVEA